MTDEVGHHPDRWPQVTERDLAAAIVRRQPAALSEAYRRHATQVLYLASRVCAARASDVTQEIFLDLWRRPERFDPDRGTLGAFLAIQARTRSIDGARADSARRGREQTSRHDRTWSVSVDELVIERDETDRVHGALNGALNAIPGPEREALVLAFFGGHSYRDVARLLGMPEGTVKSRIRSGLRHLRAEFTTNPALPAAL